MMTNKVCTKIFLFNFFKKLLFYNFLMKTYSQKRFLQSAVGRMLQHLFPSITSQSILQDLNVHRKYKFYR